MIWKQAIELYLCVAALVIISAISYSALTSGGNFTITMTRHGEYLPEMLFIFAPAIAFGIYQAGQAWVRLLKELSDDIDTILVEPIPATLLMASVLFVAGWAGLMIVGWMN